MSRPPLFSRAPFALAARLMGVASALVNIASALSLATGIGLLVAKNPHHALWLLLLAVVLRVTSSLAASAFAEHTGNALRTTFRKSLASALRYPSMNGDADRYDITLAIEQASLLPSLESTQVTAGVSLLALPIILITAGWLPFAITTSLLIVSVPLYIKAGRASEKIADRYHERRGMLESRQLAILANITELRGVGGVDFAASEIEAISASEHDLAMQAIRITLSSSLVTEFLSGVSIGLVAMVMGFGLLHQRVSLTHALIAVLVASELFVAVRRVGLDFHRSEESQRATITLSRLDTAETNATSDSFSAVDLVAIDGAVPLTFRVRPGERLLLTGPSGVGKTSTLLALLGWHAPVSGTVAAPHGPYAYVSPTSPLLAGTIRENLLLANSDRDVEVETLLTCLGLSARLCNLDTSIGSDASLLSSGERVRLVLARALLNGAQFLLLDDIAGVLDETSRNAVRELLSSATQLGIIEATVATPLLRDAIEMKCAREY